MNYFAREQRSLTKGLTRGRAGAHGWPEIDVVQPPGIIQQYGGMLVRVGVLIDAAVILLSLWRVVASLSTWTDHHLLLGLVSLSLFVVIATSSNLYRSWRTVRLRHELAQLAFLWSAAFAMSATAAYFMDDGGLSGAQKILLLFWYLTALAGMAAFRVGVRMGLRYYRAFGHDQRRVAFVGRNDVSLKLSSVFQHHPWMGIEVTGFYGDPPETEAGPDALPALSHRGSIEDLLQGAGDEGLNAIYIALPMAEEPRIKAIIDHFSDTTVSIYYCPPLLAFDPVNARWGDIDGHPVISLVESPFSGFDGRLKRAEDLVLALMILPLIAPLLLVIAIAVKLTSAGPVFFRQTRYGLDGRRFTMWKFRTMYRVEKDQEFVQARRNDPRVTPLGAVLRQTSLDELPQFFNVLVGEMSVIGPRPHPVQLNETHRKVIPRYMLRHIVKPGITGWAQVNGCRGETETVEMMRRRIELDLHYIKRWSIGLDVLILLKTLVVGFHSPRAY